MADFDPNEYASEEEMRAISAPDGAEDYATPEELIAIGAKKEEDFATPEELQAIGAIPQKSFRDLFKTDPVAEGSKEFPFAPTPEYTLEGTERLAEVNLDKISTNAELRPSELNQSAIGRWMGGSVGPMIEAPRAVAKGVVRAFGVPANILAKKAADYLAPELIEKIKERNRISGAGFLENTLDSFAPEIFMGDVTKKYTDAAYDAGALLAIENTDKLVGKDSKLIKEVERLVQKEPSLYKDPGTQLLLGLSKGKDEAIRVAADTAKLITDFGISSYFDPMRLFNLFPSMNKINPSIVNETRLAVNLGEDAVEKSIQNEVQKTMLTLGGELGASNSIQTAMTKDGRLVVTPTVPVAGKKIPMAVLQMPFPLNKLTKDVTLWSSDELDNALTRSKLWFANKNPTFASGILNDGPDIIHNDMMASHKFKMIASKHDAEDYYSVLENHFPLNLGEGRKELINNMSEFPTSWKNVLKNKGIKYSDEDVRFAEELLTDYNVRLSASRQRLKDAGINVKRFEGEPITDILATRSESRGFGRELTDLAKAKRAEFNNALEESEKLANSPKRTGLFKREKASSLFKREKLSTDAYSEVLADLWGLDKKDIFKSNPYEVMVNKLYEMDRLSNNMEYLNGALARGKTAEQWKSAMTIAKSKKTLKEIDSYEDIYLADIRHASPKGALEITHTKRGDFSPLSDDIIKYYADAVGTTQEQRRYITSQMKQLEFHLPTKLSIESMIAPLSAEKKMGNIAAYMGWWKKWTLTNPARAPKELWENAVRYFTTRGEPKYILDAMDGAANGGDVIHRTIKELETISRPGSFNISYRDAVKDAGNPENYKLGQYIADTAKAIGRHAYDPDSPLWNGIREIPSNGQDLFKSAYARQLMDKNGLELNDAIRMTEKFFMDMSLKDGPIKKAQTVSPFLNYHIQNFKSFANILATNPASINALKPDGYLTKHINSNNGFDPIQAAYVGQAVGYMPHPIFASMLNSSTEVAANASVGKRMINMFAKALSTDPEQLNGKIAVWNLPNHVSGAFDTANILSANQMHLLGPMAQAAIFTMIKQNPVTGQTIDYKNSEVSNLPALIEGLKTMLPGQARSVINNVIRPGIEKAYPEWRSSIARSGFPDSWNDSIIDSLNQTIGVAPVKDQVFKKMFNSMTFGLMSLSDMETTYDVNAASLISQINRDKAQYKRIMTKIEESDNKKLNSDIENMELSKLARVIKERTDKLNGSDLIYDSLNEVLRKSGGTPIPKPIVTEEGPTPEPGPTGEPINPNFDEPTDPDSGSIFDAPDEGASLDQGRAPAGSDKTSKVEAARYGMKMMNIYQKEMGLKREPTIDELVQYLNKRHGLKLDKVTLLDEKEMKEYSKKIRPDLKNGEYAGGDFRVEEGGKKRSIIAESSPAYYVKVGNLLHELQHSFEGRKDPLKYVKDPRRLNPETHFDQYKDIQKEHPEMKKKFPNDPRFMMNEEEQTNKNV